MWHMHVAQINFSQSLTFELLIKSVKTVKITALLKNLIISTTSYNGAKYYYHFDISTIIIVTIQGQLSIKSIIIHVHI